jgi:ribosome-binding ATPase YchF (GTP1/OBG family)
MMQTDDHDGIDNEIIQKMEAYCSKKAERAIKKARMSARLTEAHAEVAISMARCRHIEEMEKDAQDDDLCIVDMSAISAALDDIEAKRASAVLALRYTFIILLCFAMMMAYGFTVH